jgi:general secretion pathway protein D
MATGSASALAGTPEVAVPLTLVRAALGQAPGEENPDAARAKVVGLLRQFRISLDEGNFETAESYLSRAEAVKVNFGMFYLGDTPKKARQDLERVRRSPSATKKPSERFTPQLEADELAARQAQQQARQAQKGVDPFAARATNDVKLPTGDPSGQAKSYLARGRAELGQGNVTGATYWYERAVQSGATFGPADDSPEKLLADIRKSGGKVTEPAYQNTAQALTPTTPFSAQTPGEGDRAPLPMQRNAWPTSPSASTSQGLAATAATSNNSDGAPVTARFVLGQPSAKSANDPSPTPAAVAHPATSPQAPITSTSNAVPGRYATTSDDNRRAQSDGLIFAARRALAYGDVARASEAVAQAKALKVNYEFNEDSPAKVELAINKFVDLKQRPASEKDSEAFCRRYAELQLQQAEDLIKWRDFEEAERLVNEAKSRGINYHPFESSPEKVLERIAEARKKSSQIEPLPAVGDGSPKAEPALLAQTPPAAKLETPPSMIQPAAAEVPLTTAPQKVEPIATTIEAPVPQPALVATPATATPIASNSGDDLAAKKARVFEFLKQARAAMAAGDFNRAESLCDEADALQVPESSFSPQDDRIFYVTEQIKKERKRAVVTAGAVVPIGANGKPESTAVRAVYDANNDATATIPASAQVPAAAPAGAPRMLPGQNVNPAVPAPAASAPTTPPAPTVQGPTPDKVGVALFQQGEDALRRNDRKTALTLFQQAANYRADFDPVSYQRLQDRLQLVSAAAPRPSPTEGSLIREAEKSQQLKARQVSSEVGRLEQLSKELRESDPDRAVATLEEAKSVVEKAALDTASRDTLLRRVDRNKQDLQNYLEINKGKVELAKRNEKVRNEIQREQQVKVEVQEKLALLVDEFNKAMDENRFAEAEVIAKRAHELAPKEQVVMQLKRTVSFAKATQTNKDIAEAVNASRLKHWQDIDKLAIMPDEDKGMEFPDLKKWEKLTTTRSKQVAELRNRRSAKDIEIQQKLKTPVTAQYKDAPLSAIMADMSKVANINIHLDPQGLGAEGVTSDTPVKIELQQEISLKSFLNLVLTPLHLSYVIKDEVLKITSEQMRDGEVYSVTYPVADLVIPIPNFTPNGQMGLAGALADGYNGISGGGVGMAAAAPLSLVGAPTSSTSSSSVIDPKLLAQFGAGPMTGMGGMGGRAASGFPQQIPFGGPGGMGGGVQPDFDSLIELITTTIAPTTWTEVGGAGAVKQFNGNLSLVISQTQEVHEQIADLLDQLRRLQDLQVTIEVRFINLSDVFFERIGVDFNVNLPTYPDQPGQIFGTADPAFQPFPVATPPGPARDFTHRDLTRATSVTVGTAGPFAPGANQPPVFASDLEVPFRQSSFSLANPTTALFQNSATPGASGGATLGFAILSDLEAYFFIEAVQSDIRTNILQAPKVTLFNGQQAFVSDTTQSPFVISVIPVVGDFAAAQQPVIVVLSEGTFLTVQAIVSNDRRFVRLTVVPFFSHIEKVNTFTFTGSASSTRASTSTGPTGGTINQSDASSDQSAGTTVQLPQFAFQTVTTTVSVPDGGTVLLGGIKRLSEERRENGVPLLNKLPYVNRLFQNVGTGRSTTSLMMMVTPRIIIQEEEEALIGGGNTP